MDQTQRLFARIEALQIPSEEELAARVSEDAKALRKASVRELIDSMSLEALAPMDAPVSDELRTRCATLGDVMLLKRSTLQSCVGQGHAWKIEDALKTIYDRKTALAACYLDGDPRSDVQSQLVRDVVTYGLSLPIIPSLISLKDEPTKLEPILDEVADACSITRGLFLSRAARDRLVARIDELEATLLDLGGRYVSLEDSIAGIQALTDNEAWVAFCSDRDAYEGQIRQLSGIRVEREPERETVSLALEARALDERVGQVTRTLERLSIPSEHEEIEALKKLVQEERSRLALLKLGGIDVDVLASGGARVAPLRNAGFTNLGQLYGMKPFGLSRYQGISEHAAYGVVHAVNEVFRSAYETTHCRLDAESRPVSQGDLVAALYAHRRWPELRAEHKRLISELSTASEQAASLNAINDYVGNLSMTNAKRERFSKVVEVLRAKVPGLSRHAEDLVKELAGNHGAATSEAWDDFSRNAAYYYALLEQLGGGSPEVNTGDLPKTLVDEIAAFDLDTSLMKATLRGYQRFAAQYALRQRRTLIGDEMGLGKTVEAIAAMAHLAAKGEGLFLVVCPLSVLINWAREVPKHSSLDAVTIYGAQREKMFDYWLLVGGVAITTYETIQRLDWIRVERIGMLVLDEAHYVKNPQAKRTQAVTENLIPLSDHVLFLTGTPLENRVDEMNNLISYLNDSVLSDLGIATQARPIGRREEHPTFIDPIRYRQALAPVYLRRRRVDVLDELPERIDKDDWCRMSETDKGSYLEALLWRRWHDMRRVGWEHGNLGKSAKWQRLIEICEEAKASGSKVLVFSYYLHTLNSVAKMLGEDCGGVITGKVQASRRQEIIDEFSRSNKTALVCQVSAGGVGLNIQAANIVIFCEPQIKPSMEEQAISRAYRMGQVRTVVVHRLLMAETVDERIEEILWEKRTEFDLYADKSQIGGESLGIIDTAAIARIIDEERERYGITGGAASNDMRAAQEEGDTYRAPTDRRVEPHVEATRVEPRKTAAKQRRKQPRSTFEFSVAGLNKMGMGDYWTDGIAAMVTLVREPNNRYDKNAVALYVGGIKAGYVPQAQADSIARLLDQGYDANVISVRAETLPDKKRRRDEWGEYYYEEDWDHPFTVAHVRVELIGP